MEDRAVAAAEEVEVGEAEDTTAVMTRVLPTEEAEEGWEEEEEEAVVLRSV